MKLISYSIWGAKPKYTTGAIKNAVLARSVFPGWICRFYVADDTPREIIEELKRLDNVEIIEMHQPGGWAASFWRFLPASETEVEVMLSRDTDSRLGRREKAAVDEWLAGDKDFHIMRDHPWHSAWPILAGTWGVRNRLLWNMNSLIDAYSGSFGDYVWGVDQRFLARIIHPRVRTTALVHDELSPSLPWDAQSERSPFPVPRNNNEFIGQVFNEEDRTAARDMQAFLAYFNSKR